ncbi:RNA polymerase sigma factor [Neorhizobium sp. DT-125]|uniref:RNA polymerase sigma factor n=1 Tax=Neorhizobium sp. DT-125 TaxID=3396163 RepID=UPI003F1942C4
MITVKPERTFWGAHSSHDDGEDREAKDGNRPQPQGSGSQPTLTAQQASTTLIFFYSSNRMKRLRETQNQIKWIITVKLMRQGAALTVHDQIEALYVSEQRRLERLARSKVGSAYAADVVQDVFAALWSRAKEQFILSPSYLSQATRYASISHLRAEQRRMRLLGSITEDQYMPPVVLPDQIVAARERLNRIETAIAELPERTRKVFLLNRLHSCTYDEIAIALDLSYSTVERDIAKAILACRTAQQDQP